MAAEIDCDRLFSGKQKTRMLFPLFFSPPCTHRTFFCEREEKWEKYFNVEKEKLFNVSTERKFGMGVRVPS
jgi:hypothetical protein